MQQEKQKFFYGWWIVIGGLIIMMFAVPLFNALSSLFMKPITKEFDVPRSAYAMTNTIVSIMTIIMAPIAGKIYAKGNMRLIHTCCILILAVSYAGYVLARNVYVLYICAFISGLAFIAAGMLPVSTMINNWFIAKRGLAMSIVLTGISIGGMIFSPIMTQLIMAYGWRTTRLIAALVFVVVCVPITLFVMKRHPEDMGLKPLGASPSSKDNSSQDKKAPSKKARCENNIPLNTAKNYSFFYVLMAGMLFSGLITGGTIQHYFPFFSDLHGDAAASYIASFGFAMGIIGKLIVGIIFDKLGTRSAIVLGSLSSAIVFLGYAFFGQYIPVLVGLTLFDGIGGSIATVGINLLIPAMFGSKNYVEVFGVSKGFQQAGMAIGGLLIAFIFDFLGNYSMAWIFCAGLTLASLLAFLLSEASSNKINDALQANPAADASLS